MLKQCRLCPRECGADRTAGYKGACGAGIRPVIARAALHAWEEPCISGTKGSGAVFFSGCCLGCVFCQNAAISRTSRKREQNSPPILPGREVSVRQLADLFLRLQDQDHAHNLNLVTGTHFLPQIASALQTARDEGLHIPVIWNSSGYEKVSSLQLLDGLVDVYLPDFKYLSPDLAQKYSRAPDYPEAAKKALAEMVRQTGGLVFCDPDSLQTIPPGSGIESALICRGVIVRHLVLPGHTKEAKQVIRYLHETYHDRIAVSLLNQYTPMEAVQEDPLLKRKITQREYDRVTDYALQIGVQVGFLQEGNTAQESFIPAWDET